MKLMILLKNLGIIMNKKSNDIIMEFKDYYKQKNVKLDDIFNLLIDFRDYYNQKKLTQRKFL